MSASHLTRLGALAFGLFAVLATGLTGSADARPSTVPSRNVFERQITTPLVDAIAIYVSSVYKAEPHMGTISQSTDHALQSDATLDQYRNPRRQSSDGKLCRSVDTLETRRCTTSISD